MLETRVESVHKPLVDLTESLGIRAKNLAILEKSILRPMQMSVNSWKKKESRYAKELSMQNKQTLLLVDA